MASTSTLPHLPLEVVEQIFTRAAYTDPKTAHTLAYVSRYFCSFTASARWHAVALTSIRQYLYIWRSLVWAKRNPELTAHANRVVWVIQRLLEGSNGSGLIDDLKSAFPRRGFPPPETYMTNATACAVTAHWADFDFPEPVEPISLPKSSPGAHVRHLFFDVSLDPTPDPTGSDWRWLDNPPDEYHRYSGPHADQPTGEAFLTVAIIIGMVMNRTNPARYPSLAQPRSFWRNSLPIWQSFTDVHHLSIGKGCGGQRCESLLYYNVMQELNPIELTTVRYGKSRDEYLGRIRQLGQGQRPRRIHIIEDDLDVVRSQEDCVKMFNALARLRAGHVLSISQALTVEMGLEEKRRTMYGTHLSFLTHLRFDTPRAALGSPKEAHCLFRSFLQELAVVNGKQLGARQPGGYNPRQEPLIWVDSSEEARMLRSFGVGTFEQFQVAWDLPLVPAKEQRRPSSSCSMDGEAPSAFNSKIQGAVTNSIGWYGERVGKTRVKDGLHFDVLTPASSNEPHRPGYTMGEYGMDIRGGRCGLDSAFLTHLQTLVHARCWQSQGKLKYVCRAPSTVLELGKKVGAFTQEQRLRLFYDRAAGGRGSW